MALTDTIFTSVSRPGPVEAALLAGLAPLITPRTRIGGEVALRSLEGGPASRHRPTVLFFHGRGHAATVWADWLRVFTRERRVVACDLPGFGQSAARPLARRTPEDALAFFVDPLDEVAAEEGPVVLVGHSLGGLVALSIALRGRADVRALVLVGSMGLGPDVTPRARAYLNLGPERIARAAALLPGGLGGGPVAALRRELHLVRGGRPLAKEAFDVLLPWFGPAFHLGDRLDAVKPPALLLWGARDEAFPLPVAMRASGRLRRSRLEIVGDGHCPHLEAPSRSIDVVRGFLDALESAGLGASSTAP